MKDLSWVLEDMDEDDLLDIEDELNKKEKEMTKKGYEAVAEVISGPIRDRLEELEHQDVYEDIVNALADKFGEEFDNFDADKFIDAT